jgi:oxygen-independent coproporphyrinogen-3 oxidase
MTSLYIHIPFCTAKCPYCGFYSVRVKDQEVPLVINALLKEFDSYKLASGSISTIYIGGGSPSCIPESELLILVDGIIERVGGAGEFTIEVNPAQVVAGTLKLLRKRGINRLSVGAQSFSQADLDFLGRPYKVSKIEELVNSARMAGFENISLDLIFAIPGQTLAAWENSLSESIRLGVEHISAYSLTYEEGTPLKQKLVSGEVQALSEEADRQMYETTIEMLENAGVMQYELSNFARPGFECRHNLTYWANQPYIGVGPAAASFWQGTRKANVADIAKYLEAIGQGKSAAAETQVIDRDDFACQTAVLNLRRIRGIDIAEFKLQTGRDVFELFSAVISENKKKGLLVVSPRNIRLTRQAQFIADSVLADFAAM